MRSEDASLETPDVEIAVTHKVDSTPEDKRAEASAHQDDESPARHDTQLYGATAPDHSQKDDGSTGSDPPVNKSSYLTFGDKQIDLSKLRDSYVGEVVAGRFKVTDFIDRGGMGEVYKAVNEAVGQFVAIKFLNKKFTADESIVSRFVNEARSYARVNHPNAVTLLDYGQHEDGALYIITEFIEGKSLSRTIKATGPMSPSQVISIGQQCCSVLTLAHEYGVIHRDLKPDNIMLMPGPRGRHIVKILDFGIAKITDDDYGPQTETGAIFGTPEFMSPEQAKGDGAEPRSDLYALGVILYYILTGKLPFSGKNKFAVLNKHLNDAPPRPSELAPGVDVPPALEAVILKCLNKLPEQRYDSAEDLFEALEEVRDLIGSGQAETTSTELGRAPLRARAPAASKLDELGAAPVDEPAYELGAAAPVTESVSEPVISPSAVDGVDAAADVGEPAGTVERVSRPSELEFGDDLDDSSEDFDTFISSSTSRHVAPLGGLVILVILLVGGGLYFGRDATTPPQEPDPVDVTNDDSRGTPDDAEIPAVNSHVTRVLATSQVLGLLTSAQDELEDGDAATARQHVRTTQLWMSDDELPRPARSVRKELERKLSQIESLEPELKSMRASNQCARLERSVRELAKLSTGLHAQWEKTAQGCVPNVDTPSAPPTIKPPSKEKPAKEKPAAEDRSPSTSVEAKPADVPAVIPGVDGAGAKPPVDVPRAAEPASTPPAREEGSTGAEPTEDIDPVVNPDALPDSSAGAGGSGDDPQDGLPPRKL